MKNKEKVLKNHSPTTLFVADQIDITCHPDYYWEHIDTSLIKIGCKFTRHTGHIKSGSRISPGYWKTPVG